MSEVKAQEQKTDSRSIILTKDGKPFGTENAANLAMHQKGFSTETHDIVAVEGGFAIKAKYADTKPQTESAAPSASASGIKYYEVAFHGKSNPNDDDVIQLGANGELLLIKRETPVILSETFLEVARHAKYIKWDFTPGNERKSPSYVEKYPYRVLRESSEDEYWRMRGMTKHIQRAM